MTVAVRDGPGWRKPREGASASKAAAAAIIARSRGLLRADRRALERSQSLIERSRALCAVVDGRWPARPAVVAVPAWHRATPSVAAPAGNRTCARRGCGAPAVLQPWFVADVGGNRVVIGNLALRVCEAHREDLGALFADAGTAERIRRRLAGSAAYSSLRSVRVAFEVVN
jgi:hypothetical protein